jgi:integrative and conjugative element protein (TIGR02256 family)
MNERTSQAQRSATCVWFARDVIDAMRSEAERTYPRETGGVLLGYSDAANNDSVVRALVGPGQRAQHGRWSFVPDHEYHEREVARLYAVSGRIWTYLGDWHSHPAGPLSLSLTDRLTMGRIARSAAARASHPIMTIISGTPESKGTDVRVRDSLIALGTWQLGAWRTRDTPSSWGWRLGRVPSRRCQLLLAD